MTIKTQLVGSLDSGDSGTDAYYLLTRRDDEDEGLTPEQAEELFLPQVYQEGLGAGFPYCHVVRATQVQYRPDQCIVIVELRRDI